MENFSQIVEKIKNFDYDELLELNFIISKYLEDKERNKILKSHNDSLEEYHSGKLKFSSDINELKKNVIR